MTDTDYPPIIHDFPAQDSRLRPKSPLIRENERVPPEYALTQNTHPELVTALTSYLANTGIKEEYSIVLLGGGFRGAGVDFDRKLIGIGEKRFIKGTTEEILAVIGHEVAHVWRLNNPHVQGPKTEQYTHITSRQREEIEAPAPCASVFSVACGTWLARRHHGLA